MLLPLALTKITLPVALVVSTSLVPVDSIVEDTVAETVFLANLDTGKLMVVLLSINGVSILIVYTLVGKVISKSINKNKLNKALVNKYNLLTNLEDLVLG